MCNSYVTVELLETNTTFELGRCQFMMIHWTEKNEILAKSYNIKLKQTIFFGKKKNLIKSEMNLHEI